MLLDKFDVEELFDKKCQCFGAMTGTALASFAVPAGMATAANLSLVGAIVSGVGMLQQGQAQASQANFQAGVARNNAIIAQQQATRAQQQAAIDEQDFRRQQGDLMASRRALMGGGGVESGAGSPLAVSSDFAGESELNALRIANMGEVEANRLQQEVMNQQAQAGLFGMQGRQAVTSSYYRAGGTLMSGLGRSAGGFKSPSTRYSSAPNYKGVNQPFAY